MKITVTTGSNAMKDAVKVAPGLAMPALVAVSVEDLNGYDVEVDVAPRDGRLIALAVRVSERPGGLPVTGEALRSVPVATLTKHAAARLLSFQQKDGYVEMSPPRALTAAALDDLHAAGPSRESLEWVAYLYRLAVLMGEAPTKAVESALQLPRSTAGRWVALARQKGHLGPAEGPGKVGV